MSPQPEGELLHYTTAAKGKEAAARALPKHSETGPLCELAPVLRRGDSLIHIFYKVLLQAFAIYVDNYVVFVVHFRGLDTMDINSTIHALRPN